METVSLAVVTTRESAPAPLGRELLVQARASAEQNAERLLDTLQRLSNLSPADFVARLGVTLHYPVLDSQALFAATPLFDRVSLAQCLKREFLFLEHDGQALGVFADPLRHCTPGLDR